MKNEIRKTKKPNGEGYIYYYNGYWCCKKWIVENGVKKRKAIYAKIELLKKHIEKFGQVTNSDILAEDFCNIMLFWILNVKKLYVSSRTIAGNLSIFRNYIKPYFDKKNISEIGNENLALYFNSLLDKQLTKNCFYKRKFLISQFFRYLKQQDNSFNYPFILSNIKYKGNNSCINEYKAIPIELRGNFINLLGKNKLIKVVCYLGIYAGLRIGEILALKWTDIDLKGKVIKIRCFLSAKLSFDNNGQVIKRISTLGSTKTECSLRNIPIPNKLLECLLAWQNEILFLSKINNRANPIYVLGGEIPRTYVSISKMFHRFLKQNKFDKFNIHFHTLRHTYATMLLEKETNPKIVQFLLGHRSVKTTLEIYNNINSSNKYLSEKLSSIFN